MRAPRASISLCVAGLLMLGAALPDPRDDRALVADLDRAYQEAVRVKDTLAMNRILGEDFILVTGAGKIITRSDLFVEARDTAIRYEKQEDSRQSVRLWSNTAVVTALLWEKGVSHGKPFDRRLWFSDTYVRTGEGWRYVFGQSSLPLP